MLSARRRALQPPYNRLKMHFSLAVWWRKRRKEGVLFFNRLQAKGDITKREGEKGKQIAEQDEDHS